jgi:hypothetical protein
MQEASGVIGGVLVAKKRQQLSLEPHEVCLLSSAYAACGASAPWFWAECEANSQGRKCNSCALVFVLQ